MIVTIQPMKKLRFRVTWSHRETCCHDSSWLPIIQRHQISTPIVRTMSLK
jgi:hypothetical protein